MSDMSEKQEFTGYFRYTSAPHGSLDSGTFTVVDFDGMGFVLDDLKVFEGKAVRITIELNPTGEALDKEFMAAMVREAEWKRAGRP